MARQVGFTLGVAVLVAVVGTPATADARLHAFRLGWLAAAAASLAAVPLALLLVARRRRVEELVEATA
jgi:hypothetical protein